jgi:ATP-dependent helicase/nuclease subunit B
MGIKRVFHHWDDPALPQAADYLIDRYASGNDLDLSNVVLVFPGRRASRRMLELLLQRAGSRYPAFVPPRLTTFDQFPEILYPQQLSLADDVTQLLVWRHAMQRVPAREIAAALPHLPDADAFTAWMSLCGTLRQQHNELAADGMEFDAVVAALERIGLSAESVRWNALRRIQAEYLMQMDSLQLWDRQAARLIAVQQNECRTSADIILVGTVDMNRIVRQMLDQIADRVTALIHAPSELYESFDEHGCVVPAAWQDRLLNIPVASCRIVDSPGDQAREAVRQIIQRQDKLTADAVTIGVADDSLVPTLLQELSDCGAAGRWPVGVQVRDTRAYRLLQSVSAHLASARDGSPPRFSTLKDLARHPDVFDFISAGDANTSTAGISGDWLTALDRYCADGLQLSPGALLGDGSRRLTVQSVLDRVRQLLSALVPETELATANPSTSRATAVSRRKNSTGARVQQLIDFGDADEADPLIKQMSARRQLTTWADGASRLLRLIYGNRDLTESSIDHGIVTCVNAWQQAVEQLRRVPEAVIPQCTCSQAIQFLLSQIAETVVPAEEDDDAIDLLGWLELAQDDSPLLVLTGFNEGNVPESITSDVFLPNGLRETVGLTDNKRRYARDAYAVSAMMHSRREIVMISGRVDAQYNPLTPSRLFFAADPRSLPGRVDRFYDPRQSAADTEDSVPAANSATPDPIDHSKFVVPAPPAELPAPVEIPVTWFREYLHCPYRYVLNRELRLRSIDDEVLELSAAAFGNLLHTVLKRFGDSPVRQETGAKAVSEFLLGELASQATHRFGSHRSATVNVQLTMAAARLEAFADWQAQSAADGWMIHYTESDLQYDAFRDIKDRPVILAGRIDRIDRLGDSNEWRVLDYKSGENATKPNKAHRTKAGEWIDLQLPLYRLLAQSLKLEGKVHLGYVHLPGNISAVGCSIADWSDDDLESAEAEARRIAADIIDLRIDRIAPGEEFRFAEFARICQDTVVNPSVPWLSTWSGREVSK